MVNVGIGPFLMFLGLSPVLAGMILTGTYGIIPDGAGFDILTGANLWVSFGVAIALGLIAAITAVGSGLNTYGTSLTFIITFATTLYMLFMVSSANLLNGIPYGFNFAIDGGAAFCYVVGLFFLITDGSK